MRVAFCGKGGSGKTTVTSLFARYLASKQLPCLVMDGDINQHLGYALGLDDSELKRLPKLGNEIERLQQYVRGQNTRIKDSKHIIKTTPPGHGSRLFYFNQEDEISEYFEHQINGIRFMAVGGFNEEKIGTTCFHSYSAAMNIYLNHLIDKDGDFFLGDMSAGADPFTTGLVTRFDVVFLVLEPTVKSVSVYDQCKEYAAPFGIPIKVIGNKIEQDSDIEFIRSHVGNDPNVCIYKSQFIRDLEKGIVRSIEELEEINRNALGELFSCVKTIKRDWERHQKNNEEFHRRAADNWASAVYETDMRQQIDESFSYRKMLA